ncbi:hypothetical protein ACFPOE_11295 [Caenimonas terrae]|uniref:Uncharacterized protein n=1 Tax=Caenimonas terrae TaxID=696074 RepID=A0ABW0NBU5_9BURK
MANLSQSQLQFTYGWRAGGGDNAHLTGHPDRDLLNRHEGYEVLHYLNTHLRSDMDALKAERMLQYLPSNLRSFQHITQWLNANWVQYA